MAYLIYLKCDTTSGYFTNIILTSTEKQVGVHPYKSRAYRFNSKSAAFEKAKSLKATFKCILSYQIIEA